MAKRLILFRHGKSDWGSASESDHSRPLAKRGVKAAKLMGKLLSAAGVVPQLVISSSALRAKSTVELAIADGGWDCTLLIKDWLYDTHPSAIVDRIKELPEDTESVLFVGHEPTWSQLASLLMDGGNVRCPTAAVIGIDFEEAESWSDVKEGKGELVWLLPPRCFSNGGF